MSRTRREAHQAQGVRRNLELEPAEGLICTDCHRPVYWYTDGYRGHYGHDQVAVNAGSACPSPALVDENGQPVSHGGDDGQPVHHR